MAPLKEPIPAVPFLKWCTEREAQIRRELDHYPQISGSRDGGIMAKDPRGARVHERLLMEIGWDVVNGERRLHRWRNENTNGMVERAVVEEALHHAGMQFNLVYPHPPKIRIPRVRFGEKRKMTDAQVLAAHTVYIKARMTTQTLAEVIYEKMGYESPVSCAKALSVAFRGLGLPLRTCGHPTRAGTPCTRPAKRDVDYCAEHQPGIRPSHIGGYRSGVRGHANAFHPSDDLIAQARALHVEGGVSFNAIGPILLPQTPLRNAHDLSIRLAAIAARDEWHQTAHLGCSRKRIAA